MKATKYCHLAIRLKSGGHVTGRFHVSKNTNAAVRPSDAIRACRGGFFLLSDVAVCENGETGKHPSIMVHVGDISYIELPESWESDACPEAAHELIGGRIEGIINNLKSLSES